LDEQAIAPFALKTFQSSSPDLADIFKQEVGNWIALEKHPNIVRCFFMDTINGHPFMFLEWVAGDESRGTSLREWLRRGPLDVKTALRFAIDICRGLRYAGRKVPGIVHRDLKPDNVLINQTRQAKITDFGLAGVTRGAQFIMARKPDDEANDLQRNLSGVGGVVGTPGYMSPEQWQGERDIDVRADLYAVGCILYELLTGKWPFQATTISELRQMHLTAPVPTLPSQFALQTVVARCLAKARDERYPTVDKLLGALAEGYQAHTGEALAEENAIEVFNAVDYYNRGLTFAALGRQKEALRDYNQAIVLDPADAKAYNNRGLTLEALGNQKEALRDYDQAIALDPAFVLAYNNRGNTLDALGRREEALRDYSQAIALDPTDTKAYKNRGLTLAELGRREEAVRDYSQAIALDPTDTKAFYNRGNCLTELGRREEALRDYSQAIALDPNYSNAYNNRGSRLAELGRHEEALRDFDQAIALNPASAEAWFNKGALFATTGRLPESIPCFEKAYALGYQRAAEAMQQVRRELGMIWRQSIPNDPQAAFEAFQHTRSLETMRKAVQQFPILAQMIPTIEQVVQQQVPVQHRSDFEQRLVWLRQIVANQ